MFVIFLIADLIVLLACKFTYENKHNYVDGMLIGVHIPSSEVTNPKVQEICEKSRKDWKKFHRFHFIAGTGVCFICFFNFELFTIIWLIWLCLYVGGIEYLVIVPHRKMYQLKLKNHWIDEQTKHIICIDTEVAALSDKMAYSWKWHLPIAVILLVTGIWLFKISNWWIQEMGGCILYAATWSITIVMLLLHLWIIQKQNVVYSQNTKINLTINRLVKRMWSISFLAVSWVNVISWCYLVIRGMQTNWFRGWDYGVYVFLQVLGAVGFLIPVLYLYRKKQKILKGNTEPIYVDDDEYWKNGWYCNPNDPHILVQDRMNSINFSFNMARPSVKIICSVLTVLTIVVVVWVGSLLISLMNISIKFEINQNEVYLESLNYECKFSVSEIQDMEIIEQMPEENFTRTNGASTEKNNVGHFKGRETGKCMMFLYTEATPILKITLPEQVVFVNSEQAGEVQTWYKELEIKREEEQEGKMSG